MIAARAQKRRSRPYNEIGLGTNENNINLLIDELQIKRELDIKFLTSQSLANVLLPRIDSCEMYSQQR
jgi:hypothetical protein